MTVAEPKIELEETAVVFQSSQAVEMRGTIVRLARYAAVIEVYTPQAVLRTSEVLSDFKITIGNRIAYSGRAVTSSLINTGGVLVCEVALEDSWIEIDALVATQRQNGITTGFASFLQEWQKVYKVAPEVKLIVADMHSFLTDLRLWCEQVEIGIRSSPSADRLALEQDLARELGKTTEPILTSLFEKFEAAISRAEPDYQPVHRTFGRRQLHPLLLCAPFLYRTFTKPLGYAGDYEMVNMLCRDPVEGGSLFAKLVNYWFLQQPPAEAHRNRIQYLMDLLSKVAVKAASTGRRARVVSVGCGPAREVQKFLVSSHLSDHVKFTLIDFNQETIEHTRSLLESLKRQHQRNSEIEIIRRSVNQILKEGGRSTIRGPETQYEFVYCAGLFDYLSDQICRRLSNILYDWVAPGGLFVSTNVDSSNPRRITMEYIMDWHLIYRRAIDLSNLRPDAIPLDGGVVEADSTGVNIHYVAWKPAK